MGYVNASSQKKLILYLPTLSIWKAESALAGKKVTKMFKPKADVYSIYQLHQNGKLSHFWWNRRSHKC